MGKKLTFLLDSVITENKYYECFGDWWEHKVNFITRGSGLENGNSSDLKLGCDCGGGSGSGSVTLSVDGQSIPDKNNLGNGELKQEPSLCTTYFIELKGEAEMSRQVGIGCAESSSIVKMEQALNV